MAIRARSFDVAAADKKTAGEGRRPQWAIEFFK